MSAKYKSPSFLLPNEKNTSLNPSLSADRASNYSMDFDGTEYIDTNFVPADNLTLDFSVSAWVNMPALSNNNDATILGTYQFTNGRSRFFFRIYLTGGVYKYFFGLGPNTNYIQDSSVAISNFSVNTWVHLAFTYDGTNVKLYSNGTLDGTLSWSGTNNTYPPVGSGFNGNSYIGASNRTGGSGLESEFTGKIDEVAIFNKALTDGTGGTVNQIASLYNSGSPTSAATTINLGAIAYYPLGEQAQNTGYLGNEITNGWQFPNGVLQDYVMNFDGSDDFVQTSGFTIGNNYSFSCWLKSDTISPSTSVFLSSPNYYGAGYNGNFIIRFTNSTTIQMYSFDGTANQELSAATIPAIDTNWHHFFLTSNGTTTKIYWDGSPLTVTGNQTKSLDNLLQGLIIGYEVNFGNNPFSGQISNVAVWNSDQSSNIANIYNNGSPQTSYTVTPQNWWKLNADSVYTPSAPNYTTALDFNSTKADIDYVQFGNTSLSLPASLSIWLKPLGVPPSGYGMPYSDSSGEIYWTPSSNNMRYEITLAGAPQLNSTLIAPADVGGWHHLVVTFTSTATKLYLDGQLNASGSGGTGTNFGQDINIGRWKQYGTNILYGFVGSISNFAIFNSELSASQVSTLFNFGTPETNISLSPIHNWKLDNLTTGLNDTGSLASNNGTAGSVNGTGPVQELTSVAVVPSWKISSALPITTTPNYTTALDFDGSDYIDCGSSSNLELQTISVSFWIKETQNASSLVGVVAKNQGSSIGWIIWVDANNLIWQVGDGSSNDSFTNSKVNNFRSYASLNQWNNICCTFDGTDAKIYINNVLHTTWTPSSPYSIDYTNVGNLNIGKRVDRTTPKLNGSLSNVAIFNSTLTASQVSTIYNGGTPETAISFSPVSWWKLDTGGSTITDYGSGGNTGTNNGTAAQVTSDVLAAQPVNGVSTTLPSTALQQSDLQFDSPYSNYSLSFDGNSYIDTNLTLPASYTSYSYSFWFKRTTSANPGSAEYIISNLVAPGYNYQARGLIRFGGTNLRIQGGDGTGPGDYDTGNISATAILDQNWHHISVTFVSGEIKTYFDGSLVNTYTNAAIVTGYAAARTYVIGQSGIGSGYLVNSLLDEFAIFDKKLTEAEILSIYNNGKPNDISTLSPTNWWRLGENAYFNTGTTPGPEFTVPNSITGAPNGIGSGTVNSIISADAPGTYANGIGTNLDIVDRVGDAALSTANSQSYNMIPDDKVPYVPGYVGLQTNNNFSMTFDGNNKINSGTANAYNIVTLSAWVKPNNPPNYAGIFGTRNLSGLVLPYHLGVVSNKFRFIVTDSTGLKEITANTSFSNNVWYHVVGVADGSTTKLYIDGVLQTATGSYNGTISAPDDDLMIGAQTSVDTSYEWVGSIDEVAIWDTALSADQIKFDLYNATTTGKTADIANNTNLPTPVAWYRMGD